MNNELTGVITTYHAQGLESQEDLVFDTRDPGARMRDRLITPNNGDVLTIYATDNSILWHGVIKKRKGCFCLKPPITRQFLWFFTIKVNPEKSTYSNWVQKGVKPITWVSWFQHQPPLKAKLLRRS